MVDGYGDYGPIGWTRKVDPLLFNGDESVSDGLISFDDVSYKVAEEVLALLPGDADTDRQNEAPTLRELLELAVKYEGFFGGYRVGPSRDDERVTVDSVSLPVAKYKVAQVPDPYEFADIVLYVNGIECGSPDEAEYIIPDDYNPDSEDEQEALLRIWWD